MLFHPFLWQDLLWWSSSLSLHFCVGCRHQSGDERHCPCRASYAKAFAGWPSARWCGSGLARLWFAGLGIFEQSCAPAHPLEAALQDASNWFSPCSAYTCCRCPSSSASHVPGETAEIPCWKQGLLVMALASKLASQVCCKVAVDTRLLIPCPVLPLSENEHNHIGKRLGATFAALGCSQRPAVFYWIYYGFHHGGQHWGASVRRGLLQAKPRWRAFRANRFWSTVCKTMAAALWPTIPVFLQDQEGQGQDSPQSTVQGQVWSPVQAEAWHICKRNLEPNSCCYSLCIQEAREHCWRAGASFAEAFYFAGHTVGFVFKLGRVPSLGQV